MYITMAQHMSPMGTSPKGNGGSSPKPDGQQENGGPLAPSQKAAARLKADCEGKVAAHLKAGDAKAAEAKAKVKRQQVSQQTAAARQKADSEEKYKPDEQQASKQMAAARHKAENEGKVAAHLKAENQHENGEKNRQ